MVALANDWRLTEERARRFLSPARVVERYRQIAAAIDNWPTPAPSFRQMLQAVIAFDCPEELAPANHSAVD